MLGTVNKHDEEIANAYRAFSALLMRERPLTFTDDKITPDIQHIHSLQAEFIKSSTQEIPTTISAAQQASEIVIGHLRNHFAPIITTEDPTPKNKAIVMTFGGNNFDDYITWLGVRKSFENSGVTVITEEGFASSSSVWARDTSFILGDTAYLPDPAWGHKFTYETSATGDLTLNTGIQETLGIRQDNHQHILSRLGLNSALLSKCFFEGGNLIHDPVTSQIFWGDEREVHPQFRDTLADAIYKASNTNQDIRSITTDNHHCHLDLGLSPCLPQGHFLVSTGLGYKLGTYKSWGYETIRRHISDDRLITINQMKCIDYFITNLTSVGNTLFMTGCPNDLRHQLKNMGYIVNAPTSDHLNASPKHYEPSSLRRIGSRDSGGGVHCMTNEIPLTLAIP